MGRGGLGDMMKQVQQMQAKMEEVQAQLEATEVEGSSGGGMVKVVATGKGDITSLTIDPEVVDPEDVEMLQDLVQAAVNEALRKSKDMMQEEMGKITGGLPVPDIFG